MTITVTHSGQRTFPIDPLATSPIPFGPERRSLNKRAGELFVSYSRLRLKWSSLSPDDQQQALAAMEAIEKECRELLPLVTGPLALDLKRIVDHAFNPQNPCGT